MPLLDARIWAQQKCAKMVPMMGGGTPPHPGPPHPPFAPGAPLPPLTGGIAPRPPTGTPPVYHLDASAIQALLQQATTNPTANGTGTAPDGKRDDGGEFKVSDGERERMRIMCGLPEAYTEDVFPKWYWDLFGKHQDEKDKAQLISLAIKKSWIFEDAEVPLYPGLIKTIQKRDWSASDLGKRAALVNAARGLSPFAMVDLTEEDVARMIIEVEDLSSATTVSAADIWAARGKLSAKTPTSSEDFMLMLRRYTNLLYSLFSSQSPLYKQMYAIVQVFQDYSPNACSKLHFMDHPAAIAALLPRKNAWR